MVRATINGKPYTAGVPAEELLLDFLRDRLGLTGTKQSCEVQVCGVCTVLVDGDPVKFLLLPRGRHRRPRGRDDRGPGGLGLPPARGRRLRSARRRAVRLLHGRPAADGQGPGRPRDRRRPGPDRRRDERQPLPLHRLRVPARCPGRASGPAMNNPVGQSVERADGPLKLSGQAEFTGDIRLPGMLYAAVLHSPLAHARIRVPRRHRGRAGRRCRRRPDQRRPSRHRPVLRPRAARPAGRGPRQGPLHRRAGRRGRGRDPGRRRGRRRPDRRRVRRAAHRGVRGRRPGRRTPPWSTRSGPARAPRTA